MTWNISDPLVSSDPDCWLAGQEVQPFFCPDLRADPRAKKFTGLTYTASAQILGLITPRYFNDRTHSEKAGASCSSNNSGKLRNTENEH
jgi:hypothetical protein